MNKRKMVLGALRLVLGFIFLWAFLDKAFGLGFATDAGNAWIAGGSPTYGFLSNAVRGPFASFFQGLAGSAMVDWLFMLGLLFSGLTLISNKFVKLGCATAGLMMALIYLSLLPPENNPAVDEHIVYILALALIAFHDE